MAKSTSEIKIQGMGCFRCVLNVRKALLALDPSVEAEVAVGSAKVSYDPARVDAARIRRAVEAAGYKVAAGG